MKDDKLVKQITASLIKMLGELDITNSDDVWDKISKYKKWDLPQPKNFIIQGRLVSGGDKQILEFESINILGIDTISFSFQDNIPGTNNDSYALSIKYPEKILIIIADTFRPISKVVSLVDGSIIPSII